MKYRKKPLVIEAWQWNGEIVDDLCNVPEWLHESVLNGDVKCYMHLNFDGAKPKEYGHTLVIKTLEGEHKARIGDYIIRGVKGELYPCKPDIFLATYEEVPE